MTIINKNCKACGDLIEVRLADHKRGWGNFCDKACSAAYKVGMRPKDVNEYHARCQGGYGWAADMLKKLAEKYGDKQPPKSPSIEEQVGRVKIKKRTRKATTNRRKGVLTNVHYQPWDDEVIEGDVMYSRRHRSWVQLADENGVIDDIHPFSSEALGQD